MQSGVYRNFDPKFSSLQIKTNSVWGSGEKVELEVVVKSFSGAIAGRVFLYFTSPPRYHLGYCSKSQIDFYPGEESATDSDNIWTITLKKTSYGDRNVVIQYNNVEVVNVVLSDEKCDNGDWREYWSKDIAEIRFSIADTASDFFQLKAGKIQLWLHKNDFCLYFNYFVKSLVESDVEIQV